MNFLRPFLTTAGFFLMVALTVVLPGFASVAQGSGAEGISSYRPQLLPQKGYTETWDQHVYFDDGTFVTARFLILNLSKGKPRAFVISTLVTPDGHIYTVKNGRDKGGWSFDPNHFDLHIANHRLNGDAQNYKLYLHNNTAEVLLTLASPIAPWQVGRLCCGTSAKAYQDMIAYIPVAEAEGWWRPGEDGGGKGDEEPWRQLKGGKGFATHYVNSQSVENVARNWLHFFAFDNGQGPVPGIVSISLPEGGQMTRLALLDHHSPGFETNAASIETVREAKGRGNDVIPAVIGVSANENGTNISGTITFDKELEHISLRDKLSWVERLFAASLPSTVQYYYLVHYELKVQTGGNSRNLTGKGLVEYTTISKP
jgi:hypothetical protein